MLHQGIKNNPLACAEAVDPSRNFHESVRAAERGEVGRAVIGHEFGGSLVIQPAGQERGAVGRCADYILSERDRK